MIKTQGFMVLMLWSTTFFENHDQPRSISNFGSRRPEHFERSGKLLALMLATMSGTLFIYQGQEIGMRNIPKTWPRSELRDIFWITFLEAADKKFPDNQEMHERALDVFERAARDHARTPVQRSAEEPHAGFSTAQPWMRINENFRDGFNVQDQIVSESSLLSFWHRLLKFRKQQVDTMIYGDTIFIDNDNKHVLSVVKREHGQGGGKKRILVAMNYSDDTRPLPSLWEHELGGKTGELLFAAGSSVTDGDLKPWEGRVFAIRKTI